jgi:hypothetical protein
MKGRIEMTPENESGAHKEDVFDRVRRKVREKQEAEADARRRFEELTGRKEKEDDELDKSFGR